MMTRDRRRLGFLWFGAAACAACCVWPVVAFLGALGVAGTVLFGVAGATLAAAAAVVMIAVRRWRKACASTIPGPVPIAAPVLRGRHRG